MIRDLTLWELNYWHERAQLWKRLYELRDCDCQERDEIWLKLNEEDS